MSGVTDLTQKKLCDITSLCEVGPSFGFRLNDVFERVFRLHATSKSLGRVFSKSFPRAPVPKVRAPQTVACRSSTLGYITYWPMLLHAAGHGQQGAARRVQLTQQLQPSGMQQGMLGYCACSWLVLVLVLLVPYHTHAQAVDARESPCTRQVTSHRLCMTAHLLTPIVVALHVPLRDYNT